MKKPRCPGGAAGLSLYSVTPPKRKCQHVWLISGREIQRLIILRKEVIQPQVPLRLPCYDLVPITGLIFGACLLTAPATSDAPRFGGLTGGVYKAQEHIHRGSADPRLLAIPAS